MNHSGMLNGWSKRIRDCRRHGSENFSTTEQPEKRCDLSGGVTVRYNDMRLVILIARLNMQVVKVVVWQEGDSWIGYLQEYPDYWTQGDSLDDLKEHLRDLYTDLSSGSITGIRRVEDLIVS